MPIKLLAVECSLLISGIAVYLAGLFAAGDDAGNSKTVIGALVAGFTAMVGLMAWVIKHLLDKTIPEQTKAYHAEMDAHRAEIASARETFEKTIKALIDVFQGAQDRFQAIVERQSQEARADRKEIVQTLQQEIVGEHNEVIVDLRKTMEEVREVLIIRKGDSH
jgi:DNA anti-recombination protein RmuC